MAKVCFQLFRKRTGEPVLIEEVDQEICLKVLSVPVHPKFYGGGERFGGFNWYDSIGWAIAHFNWALGTSSLRAFFLDDPYMDDEEKVKVTKVLDYMEIEFESHSFARF